MKHVRQRKSVLHKLLRTLAFPGAGGSYFKKITINCNTVDTLASLFQILGTIRHTIDFSTFFFLTFDMDKLRKIHRLRWKECLLIRILPNLKVIYLEN